MIRICNNLFEQCVICRFNKVVYVCSVRATEALAFTSDRRCLSALLRISLLKQKRIML